MTLWKDLLSLVTAIKPDFSRRQVRAALRYKNLVKLFNIDREELMTADEVKKKGPPAVFKLTSKGKKFFASQDCIK